MQIEADFERCKKINRLSPGWLLNVETIRSVYPEAIRGNRSESFFTESLILAQNERWRRG